MCGGFYIQLSFHVVVAVVGIVVVLSSVEVVKKRGCVLVVPVGDGVFGASEKLLVVGIDEGNVLAVEAVRVVLHVVEVLPEGLSDPAVVLRGLVSVEVIVLHVCVVVPSPEDASVLRAAVDSPVEADCLVVGVLS